MSLQNRNTLKTFFRKGQMPTEGHFNDLIESMVNKVDDGLSKTIEDGLQLSPIGPSQKLLSFYKSIEEKNPAWSMEIDPGSATLYFNNRLGDTVLALSNEGKVGINNRQPVYPLDVQGAVGMQGRVGTFAQGKIPADGQWHAILSDLNGCQAFEVMAGVGKKKTGKYSLIHALALSTFGKSRPKIKIQQAYYGVRCNQLQLRWRGETYAFQLEMRTRCSYDGQGAVFAQYFISKLWQDEMMDGSFE
ncbi:MAG: hypothetical protein OHK0053_12140 [Microscillaceae bacterium]